MKRQIYDIDLSKVKSISRQIQAINQIQKNLKRHGNMMAHVDKNVIVDVKTIQR